MQVQFTTASLLPLGIKFHQHQGHLLSLFALSHLWLQAFAVSPLLLSLSLLPILLYWPADVHPPLYSTVWLHPSVVQLPSGKSKPLEKENRSCRKADKESLLLLLESTAPLAYFYFFNQAGDGDASSSNWAFLSDAGLVGVPMPEKQRPALWQEQWVKQQENSLCWWCHSWGQQAFKWGERGIMCRSMGKEPMARKIMELDNECRGPFLWWAAQSHWMTWPHVVPLWMAEVPSSPKPRETQWGAST